MATTLRHRKVNIAALDGGGTIAGHCRPGDIAIVADDAGWWVLFVGADGRVDSYEAPFASHREALWAAKAAAEYGLDRALESLSIRPERLPSSGRAGRRCAPLRIATGQTPM